MSVVLGRRLLAEAAPRNAEAGEQARLRAHDRFFCETMENIPAALYFPTDAEANWRKHQPKKYHKNVQAARQQESSKKALLKRAKFSPAAQQSNEARQQAAAQQEQQQQQDKPTPSAQAEADAEAGAPAAGGLEGLRARLAVKIQAMREQRKAEEKTLGRKRPSRAEQAAEQRALKKRKAAASKSKAKADKREREQEAAATADEREQEAQPEGEAASISYGSLLLEDAAASKPPQPKTRNGQGVRGIQNLLKKAERNAQRLAELKRTEEGAAQAQQKGWRKALAQAAGDVVLDDPKLLRAKLKKKEKAKAKSAKEWQERTAKLEVAKKDRQKKKLANALGRKDRAKDGAKAQDGKKDKKGRAGPRAGFEGKKGEAFLNADKNKAAPKGKTRK